MSGGSEACPSAAKAMSDVEGEKVEEEEEEVWQE